MSHDHETNCKHVKKGKMNFSITQDFNRHTLVVLLTSKYDEIKDNQIQQLKDQPNNGTNKSYIT